MDLVTERAKDIFIVMLMELFGVKENEKATMEPETMIVSTELAP